MSKTIILTDYEADLLDLVFTEALSSQQRRLLRYELSSDYKGLDVEGLKSYAVRFTNEVDNLTSNISKQYDEQRED